jgi:hypothetical protein
VTWKKTDEFYGGIENKRYVGFQLRQSPVNSNRLAASTSEGIFMTANGGASWSRSVFEDLDGVLYPTGEHNFHAFDVEYKPGSSSVLYAAIRVTGPGDHYAFFRSTNSGVLFEEIDLSDEIDVEELIRFEVGVTPAEPNSVFLACGPGYLETNDGSNDTFLGFLKSTNSGESFSLLATEPDIWGYNPTFGITAGNQCFYDMALAISPVNPDYIFTGGLVIFRSTDGGYDFDGNSSYWQEEVGEYVHPDIHDLKYNPLDGRLYAATDGGVYYSPNDGGAWEGLYNGLAITQFYHIEPDNENNKLWGGSQDNGVLEQESGTAFSEFMGGDGYDLMTDNPVGDGNDSYWTTNGGAYTSTNTGTEEITPPNDYMEDTIMRRDFGVLEMHPSNEDYIYIGYRDGIWYSPERGDVWDNQGSFNLLTNGVYSLFPDDPPIPVTGEWVVQACESDVSRIYSAGSGQFFMIYDIDFTQFLTGEPLHLTVELANAGFPHDPDTLVLYKVTDILVHPDDSYTFWVTASGFSEGNKVFYTDFGASELTNISYNLPNVPANCLLRDNDGTVYVGMDIGVFYLPPGEENWIPFYNGLPRVPVTEMYFVTEFVDGEFVNYIYAGTYGRGIWKSQKFTGCDANIPVHGVLRGDRFYQASNSIVSHATFAGGEGTNVYFQSGNSITLETGFESSEAIKFSGFIQPCNTGPLQGLNGEEEIPENRATRRMMDKPVVIESMVEGKTPNTMSVKFIVRTSCAFTIEAYNREGDPVRTIQPEQTFTPGKYRMDIPTADLPKGVLRIALTNDEGVIHVQEMEVK